MQIIIEQGVVVGVASFTTGFVPRQCTTRPPSEKDVWARALWLDRHGQGEEAEKLLDQWCAR
jgi:hypothetical protein